MGKIIKNGISYAGVGAEGKSAYQTWLDLGNTGTEQDFLNSLGGKTYTSLAELGLTADATVEDVVNALKNGESFLAPVNTFTNYETMFPNKVPNDKWNKIHIIKGTSLASSHIRCFSPSGSFEYLANINNANIVSWNDVSGTHIDISDSIVEKLGNEILKYPVGKYRINSTTTGNKFIDLPSDAEIKCGLIEVNGTAVGKSPFTDTWVYRMYKFECLTGTSSYVRRLNSGATVGQIEVDTGWRKDGQETYTSLSELGLTADATFQDVIDKLPKGGSALLGVKEFTNYQTIFPYEDGNDQFGRVHIVKGTADGGRVYARWFRKDGVKEAIASFNINDNKFSGWQSVIVEDSKTDPYSCTGYKALTGTEDLFTLPCGHYVSDKVNTTYNYPITDTSNVTAHIYVLGCLNDPTNNKGYRIILYFDNKGRMYRINEWWGVFTDNGWQELITKDYVDSKIADLQAQINALK